MTLFGESGLITVLLTAFGLSADCFAVALGAGCSHVPGTAGSRWRVLRVASSFGLFQGIMPVLGWLAGRTIVGVIGGFDHWVAFGLLAAVGGHMLWESFRPEEHKRSGDVTRGFLLLTLSLATSIDALAVGLSFGLIEINIALASATIAIVAFAATALAFPVGRKAGEVIGKRAETLGGLVLIGIGVRILLSHLL